MEFVGTSHFKHLYILIQLGFLKHQKRALQGLVWETSHSYMAHQTFTSKFNQLTVVLPKHSGKLHVKGYREQSESKQTSAKPSTSTQS